MKRLITAAAALMIVGGPAQAEVSEIDGNTLLAICENTAPVSKQWCNGYILGVSDMMFDDYLAAKPACARAALPQSQLVAIVIKDMKDDPKYLHIPARYLIAGAMVKAFPCRGETGEK